MTNDADPNRAVDAEAPAVSAPETLAAESPEALAAGPAGTPEVEFAKAAPTAAPSPKTVQLKLSTLALAAAAVLVIGALITTTALWLSARGDLSDRDAQAADEKHAEQVATDYSVGASNINFSDLTSWTTRLKANTTPHPGQQIRRHRPEAPGNPGPPEVDLVGHPRNRQGRLPRQRRLPGQRLPQRNLHQRPEPRRRPNHGHLQRHRRPQQRLEGSRRRRHEPRPPQAVTPSRGPRKFSGSGSVLRIAFSA